MTPACPDDFRLRALEAHLRLEVPKCRCRKRLRQVCEDDGGCRERQENGRCDCPCWYGPPCKHITAISPTCTTIQKWARLLAYLYPGPEDGPPTDPAEREAWEKTRDNGYREMPPCPPERGVLAHEAILEVMTRRAAAGVSLRHEHDIWRNNPLRTGPRVLRLRNGGDTQGDTVMEGEL